MCVYVVCVLVRVCVRTRVHVCESVCARVCVRMRICVGVRAGPGTAVKEAVAVFQLEMMVICTRVGAEEVTRRDQILHRSEG